MLLEICAMPSTLIICEKNIAAQRIAKILSKNKSKSIRVGKTPVYEFDFENSPCKVVGLRGHIISLDYPSQYNQWRKISPKELISVEPVKKLTERSIGSTLKTLADNASEIIIATDFDREGELIGKEALDQVLKHAKNAKIKRAKFSAITNTEINNAFSNLVEIDYNLAYAGEARQHIDLVWGAVLTRFISLTSRRLGKEFLSIGRVQSPTLAILVEREKEIKSFVPEPFWKITAKLKKDTIDFDALHIKKKFSDEAEAKAVFEKVKDAKQAKVKELNSSKKKETPPPPFSTTLFLQAASNLGLSASKAMSIAEELYMDGVISYPRTDNTVYPKSLEIKAIVTKLAASPFSKEAMMVMENGRKTPTRGKKETTDHPPIHPVDVPKKKLAGPQMKVYELVCRRFLATLAMDALSESSNVTVDINAELFKANGYRLIEANWKDIYYYSKKNDNLIPQLTKGELVDVKGIDFKKDQTKPPKRYTQGSLVGLMEKLSLGTKSTRHEIINKLYSRHYITSSPPIATSTAIAVIDAMQNTDVVNPEMTATLEQDMDLIADGKKTFDETVEDSRKMLKKVMVELEKDKEKIRESITKAHVEQNTVGHCSKCGKALIIRHSRRGKRFVGCTGFPNCKNTYSLPQYGNLTPTDKTCTECGSPIVLVRSKGKKRPWEFCLNPECSMAKKQIKNKEGSTLKEEKSEEKKN